MTLVVGVGPAAAARHAARRVAVHAVYLQTNNPGANQVVVFRRRANGTITQRQVVRTGGRGTSAQQPFGLPVVDSQDSVVLSPNRELLFVVNSGDNTVTSFRVSAGGLRRADIQTSGGILPVSLAVRGNTLYVLNGLSGSIMGYHFSRGGKLTPIVHSAQPLSVVGPNGIAADIGFTPAGTRLVVAMRYLPLTSGTMGQPGLIDTFRVFRGGSVGAAVRNTAATPTAFGFRFTSSGVLVDTSVGEVSTINNAPPPLGAGNQMNGSLASYRLDPRSGRLRALSNVPSGGRAACWVAVPRNGKFAFVTNTLSATATNPAPGNPIGTGKSGLARYSIGSDGTLRLLGNVDTGPGTPEDVGLSPDDRYLYMDDPSQGVLPGNTKSHVEVYRVGADGGLTRLQATPPTLPFGLSGVAVS